MAPRGLGLDAATACSVITGDAQLSQMADVVRPYCSLLQDPNMASMITSMASQMGLSPDDVSAVLSCLCGGGAKRRALAAAPTSVPAATAASLRRLLGLGLTTEQVAALVAQSPEVQELVDAIRPLCGYVRDPSLGLVDALTSAVAGQGFDAADVTVFLDYLCPAAVRRALLAKPTNVDNCSTC